MNELELHPLEQLSPGQKAVVDAYLESYEPSDLFDINEHILVDTQQMMLEMGTMCDFDANLLCDYLVEKGYRPHYENDDAISGWILKKIIRT